VEGIYDKGKGAVYHIKVEGRTERGVVLGNAVAETV